MRVARRAGGRMAADVRIGLRQGVDETQRRSLGVFGHVVRENILDIQFSQLARNHGLGPHGCRRALPVSLAAPRTRSRKPSK